MNDELALEVFGILTEYEFETLGEQKEFCRKIANWHLDKTTQLSNETQALKMVLFTSHATLGIEKKETQSMIDEAIEIANLRKEQSNVR